MEPTIAGAAAPSEAQSSRLTLLAGLLLLVGSVLFIWQTSSAYEIYKAIHVGFAVFWVGGGFVLLLIGLLAERANDPVEMATIVKYAEKVGTRLFVPAGLIVFAF